VPVPCIGTCTLETTSIRQESLIESRAKFAKRPKMTSIAVRTPFGNLIQRETTRPTLHST